MSLGALFSGRLVCPSEISSFTPRLSCHAFDETLTRSSSLIHPTTGFCVHVALLAKLLTLVAPYYFDVDGNIVRADEIGLSGRVLQSPSDRFIPIFGQKIESHLPRISHATLMVSALGKSFAVQGGYA